MQQGSIRLGRILGVPLSMNLGVLVIGALLSWSLATVVLPNGAPGLTGSVYWSVGAIGAVVFLASLLAHEMAHAIVARRNDVQVTGITLWLFGGFAQFENEPKTPGAEFRITAAGPATSLGLAALFVGAWAGLSAIGAPEVYSTMFGWLGIINGFLGVFNLLPGAPLDGGRILAAGLWKLRGDRVRGRIGAAKVGKFVGLGLVGLGVAEMLALGGFGGIWTALIGWFLFNAARVEERHFVGERALGDLSVAEAMSPVPPTVPMWTSVAELVDGPLRSTQTSVVAVTDWGGNVMGIVTMDAVRRVPAERWSHHAGLRGRHHGRRARDRRSRGATDRGADPTRGAAAGRAGPPRRSHRRVPRPRRGASCHRARHVARRIRTTPDTTATTRVRSPAAVGAPGHHPLTVQRSCRP